jgi:hypothetical protein
MWRRRLGGYHGGVPPPSNMKRGGFMPISWMKDADAALNQAKQENKLVLLDFSAAPM